MTNMFDFKKGDYFHEKIVVYTCYKAEKHM